MGMSKVISQIDWEENSDRYSMRCKGKQGSSQSALKITVFVIGQNDHNQQTERHCGRSIGS